MASVTSENIHQVKSEAAKRASHAHAQARYRERYRKLPYEKLALTALTFLLQKS